ncbi:hypothetical protein AArcMg_2105 [Natrarchaeobaculum sulfurireducens]|uniref:DNA methylase N-4/N-6 domain-containing protein n=2 Tax=Natrarchaeobaculum sulfurireducens TaxID=2044521 RepID=A0A346PRF8_9EURY|nr:hypothetical protein AArcMg_2105 [Natrarchaeobaculum sulfurireducens]
MEDSSTKTREEIGNQMYIVDLRSDVSKADSLEDALSDTEGIWESIYERMDSSEVLWVVLNNEYRDGQCWPAPMAFADYIREVAAFDLKNTITVHLFDDAVEHSGLTPSYCEILLLVRDKREYQFHKDRIRIEHVYKGKEWGGERNEGNSAYHDTKVTRYNEDGRDPGNVWLREIRDETSDQSVDRAEPISLTEAIERCILVGSNEDEKVVTYGIDEEVETAISNHERRIRHLEFGENGVIIND